MLKIVYFLALKCSNRAHNELYKHTEALFFIRGGGLAYKSPFEARRQLQHPHRQEAWDARRRGGHSSPLLLGQALAGAAGAGGGAGGTGAALLNPSPSRLC